MHFLYPFRLGWATRASTLISMHEYPTRVIFMIWARSFVMAELQDVPSRRKTLPFPDMRSRILVALLDHVKEYF